jgi:hypothetical protein
MPYTSGVIGGVVTRVTALKKTVAIDFNKYFIIEFTQFSSFVWVYLHYIFTISSLSLVKWSNGRICTYKQRTPFALKML